MSVKRFTTLNMMITRITPVTPNCIKPRIAAGITDIVNPMYGMYSRIKAQMPHRYAKSTFPNRRIFLVTCSYCFPSIVNTLHSQF